MVYWGVKGLYDSPLVKGVYGHLVVGGCTLCTLLASEGLLSTVRSRGYSADQHRLAEEGLACVTSC